MRHHGADERTSGRAETRATDGRGGLPDITRRRALEVGAVAVGSLAIEAAGARADAPSPGSHGLRSEVSFDQDWLFFRGDASGADASSFDDSAWRKLDLPHDWSIEDLPYATSADGGATADGSAFDYTTGPTTSGPNPPGTPEVIGPFDHQNSAGGSSTGYTVGGVGWYRKHFVTPPGHDRHVELRFDGVYQNADVWLNGVHLGFHPYGYTSFAFDLTPNLTSGVNVIAVRVNNSGQTSRWYSGSGIYQHTWLTVTAPVRIPLWGVYVTTPVVDKRHSVAHVEVEATNLGTVTGAATVRVSVLDENRRTVDVGHTPAQALTPGATTTYGVDLSVNHAALWSPDSPTLYQAQAELLVDGRAVDSVTVTFGIRSLEWDENGFLLNGKPVKVRGACTHSSHGPLGTMMLGRSEEREIEVLQAAGFNALRTAHNPVAPAKLDACDRRGMVVWNEFSDVWDRAKKTDDYHLYFPDWWERDLTSLVRRDRNHPSVVIWSLGNEITDTTGGSRGQQLYDLVHALDPSRPVTQAAGPFATLTDPLYQYVDVSDFHYDNPPRGTAPPATAASLHAAFPNKAVTKSESWPATIYDDWQLTQNNAWFVGAWVWAAWDYLGEAGTGAPIYAPPNTTNLPVFGSAVYPWFQDFQGDIDLIGQRKPQNYWRSVVYGLSPIEMMVERPAPAGTQQYAHNWSYYDELPSWTWDVPDGQVMTLHVYTTGDTVSVQLNGQAIATNTVAASDKRVSTFNIPYAPGELTAVASLNGREIGRRTLTTTGRPAALRLSSDVDILSTGRDDLAHVLVEVLDGKGQRVPDAVLDVSFAVGGTGELVGVGNGNPHNIDSFKRSGRYTWHGQALAIIRPAKTPGRVTLTASAPGLRTATLSLAVRPASDHHVRHSETAIRRRQRRHYGTFALASIPAPLLIVGAVLRRRLAKQDWQADHATNTQDP